MGILLIYVIGYYAGWLIAARLRNLRVPGRTWSTVMLLAPLGAFFLGFVHPLVWMLTLAGLGGYVWITARSELRLRRAYMQRLGVKIP